MFEEGNYPKAKARIIETIAITGEGDSESIGLLGHCHAKLGETEEAAKCLRKSIELLQAEGLPHSHVQLELSNVEEEMRGYDIDPAIEEARPSCMWLINMSARRYHELTNESEINIEKLIRPMGNQPMPGDFCFFATSSNSAVNSGTTEWKIGAIYTVDSEPLPHPVDGYQTAMRLVSRPPQGLSLIHI